MAGNHNFEMYKQLLLPLYHQVNTTLNNYAVPAAPVDTANVQLDIDLAQITRARLIQQRGTIQSKVEAIVNTTQEWQNAIQQLARAARNVADEEFNIFCANNNTAAIRNDADARIDAINDRLGDVDIFIVTRRYALPAPAAAPLPAAGAPVPDDLSKLEVPKFSGDKQSDWFEWLGQFNSVVGENGRLTDLRKFAHLKSLMEGEAAKVIKGITLSAANYQIAFDALKVQYGNKELYKLNLLDKLDHLPLCRNFYDVMAFRLEVDSICRLITNADPANHDMEAKTVATRLEAKLTLPLMREVAIERARVTAAHLANPVGVADWTTTQFRTLLGILVDREKLMYGMRNGDSSNKRPSHEDKSSHKPKSEQATRLSFKGRATSHSSRPNLGTYLKKTLVYSAEDRTADEFNESDRTADEADDSDEASDTSSTSSESQSTSDSSQKQSNSPVKTYYCRLCSENGHQASNCPKFPSVKDRKKRANALNICTRCFFHGHDASECPNKLSPCRICQSMHHIVFCSGKKPSPRKTSVNKNQTSGNSSSDGEEVASTALSSEIGSSNTMHLLMCGKAVVYNPSAPLVRKTATIFLDTGAQRSYITSQLAQCLKLSTISNETVKIHPFGSDKPISEAVKLSPLCIFTSQGRILDIEVSQLPFLVGNVQSHLVSYTHDPELEKLSHTGPIYKCQPDIIIGVDYYWRFKPKYLRSLPSGFDLVQSCIGYHIFGRGQVDSASKIEIEASNSSNSINSPLQPQHSSLLFKGGVSALNNSRSISEKEEMFVTHPKLSKAQSTIKRVNFHSIPSSPSPFQDGEMDSSKSHIIKTAPFNTKVRNQGFKQSTIEPVLTPCVFSPSFQGEKVQMTTNITDKPSKEHPNECNSGVRFASILFPEKENYMEFFDMSKEEAAKFNLCPKRALSPSFQGENVHTPLKINTFESQLDETTSSCEQSSIESESGHVKNLSKSSLSPRKRSKFRDIYKIIITTFIMLLASNLLTTPCSEHSSITSISPIRFNDGVETHLTNGICPSFQGRIQHFDNATPPKPPDIPSTRKISTASVHQFIKPPSSNIALDDSPQYSPITIFAHIATNLHLIT